MKKYFKPASILLYFLVLLTFFILGTLISSVLGAAANQGLAGGAIVLGYGVITAAIAFVVAIVLAGQLQHRQIIRVNQILGALLVILVVSLFIRFKLKQHESNSTGNIPVEPTHALPVKPASYSETQKGTGSLGFFSPDIDPGGVLHFIQNPISGEPAVCYDSIAFTSNHRGQSDIGYAPPWLVPEHLKLDYDVLYFQLLSVGRDFAELEVNKHTGQTAFVPREEGAIYYWPEFLLSVHSVEFEEGAEQKVYIKPLAHASLATTQFTFMRPIRIRDNWMQVELQDENYSAVGTGWIKWQNNGKILVEYSLFS